MHNPFRTVNAAQSFPTTPFVGTALPSEFRAGWKDCALSAAKKLERLRSIFRFAVDRGWIKTNPAHELKMPKVTQVPTLPFTDDEMERIIKAAESGQKFLTFVYVMRCAHRFRDTFAGCYRAASVSRMSPSCWAMPA